jgi:hypothetical protein
MHGATHIKINILFRSMGENKIFLEMQQHNGMNFTKIVLNVFILPPPPSPLRSGRNVTT